MQMTMYIFLYNQLKMTFKQFYFWITSLMIVSWQELPTLRNIWVHYWVLMRSALSIFSFHCLFTLIIVCIFLFGHLFVFFVDLQLFYHVLVSSTFLICIKYWKYTIYIMLKIYNIYNVKYTIYIMLKIYNIYNVKIYNIYNVKIYNIYNVKRQTQF